MRISGIVSGMDTDTMVQSMMKAERMKLTRFEQSKQIALWRQESYNSINKMFANFILNTKKDIGLKSTNSKGVSFDKSYTSLDYVKKATSSNELAATVSSTSKAVNGSFSIEVMELAKGATIVNGDINKDTIGSITDIKIELEVDGKSTKIEIANNVANMKDLVSNINSYKVDGKSIGLTAFYDEQNNKLFIQSAGTGEKVKVKLDYTKDGSVKTDSVNGRDAEIRFNGGTETLKYSSNNFNLNGVDIELKTKGISTNINVSTNVDGIMDKVKKLVEDYNALIDVASGLLSEKKYPTYKPLSTEERNGMKENDVKLWDEKAKSGLLNNDETINRMLQTMRNNLYKDLDSKVETDEVTGKKVYNGFGHITQIGISTVAYARGTAGGKLQIDEDKLRDAIMKDPEGVMELLFKDGKFKEDGKEDIIKPGNSTKGIFTRIYDDLIDGMKAIIDKSGTGGNSDLYRNVKSNILIDFVTTKSSISDIDKSITEMNRQMDNLNILFAKKEESYYAKFTQMEKYMQQMNSQSGWLSQQFMR